MVAFLREGRLTAEELVDDTGNVPADVLYSGFYMQAPTTEVAQKATLLASLWNDEFVEGFQAMSQWSRDHVPFPGAMFRELVEELVRKNVLMTGSIRIGDRKVNLADVRGNVLNAMAERDNVVPPAAVEPVMQLSAIRRAARSCGCPAATSRSAPAAAPSSTRCPALPAGSSITQTNCPEPKEW